MSITQISHSNNYQANQDLPLNNSQQTPVKFDRQYPIPTSVEVKVIPNEEPKELHRRLLMEAASEAGLDGTNEQKRFVEHFLKSGIKFANKKSDPSPDDDLSVKKSDLRGGWQTYELGKDEKETLRNLQISYKKSGNILHNGKTYENTAKGENFRYSQKGRTPQKVLNAKEYEAAKHRELWEKAQLINSTFGTPDKLDDIKRPWVIVGDSVKASDKDGILSAYINKNYSKGNLWGYHKQEILEIAKQSGVSIENTTVENGVARFDISVENLLKLHIAYIGVQEKVNHVDAIGDRVKNDMALNQFLKGVGEGAWGTLKENWRMVTNPTQTIKDIGEAISTIANLSSEDIQKIYQNLKAEGYKFAVEKDLKDVSREVGRVVGGLLIEAALGKGIVKLAKLGITLGKTLKGTKLATEIANKTKQIGNTLGKTQIPVPGVKVITDTMGNKIAVPDVELKKLADLVNQAETSTKKSPLDKINDPIEMRRTKEEIAYDISVRPKRAKKYAKLVKSNETWKWSEEFENVADAERVKIKQEAIKQGLLPKIKVDPITKFADFSKFVLKELQLPKHLWDKTDHIQFSWLNKQIGGEMKGYTWHHHQDSGKMQLVPLGIHNMTFHYGGRQTWAKGSR